MSIEWFFSSFQRACINRSLLQVIEREPDQAKKKTKKDPSQRKRRQSSKSENAQAKDTDSKDSENVQVEKKETVLLEGKENPPISTSLS